MPLTTSELLRQVKRKGGRVLVVSEDRPRAKPGESTVPVETLLKGLPD